MEVDISFYWNCHMHETPADMDLDLVKLQQIASNNSDEMWSRDDNWKTGLTTTGCNRMSQSLEIELLMDIWISFNHR